MNKILVTGGTGLIGSCFQDERFVRTPSREAINLLDRDSVSGLMSGIRPEGVIHLAAKVGGVKGNMSYPADFTYQNLMMNTIVIEEARLAGVKKLIFFASTCVFPDKTEYPLTPDKIHLGPPHNSNYGYAYSKRMADVQIQAYREQYGVNYFSVIPCNVYGPNDNYNMENGHVIPSLIHKFYLAKEKGEDVTIWGSGAPLREFMFSKDIAKLTELLYDNYEGGEPIILSSGQEISIKSVVEMIADIFEFKGKIIFDTSKPEGQFRKPSDNSVIRSMFPDFEFTLMEDGLRESIGWFVENYPNIRL